MSEFREYLVSAADAIGIRLRPDEVDLFCTYKELLIERNKLMNLTSIKDDLEIAIKHFTDSLTCLLVAERAEFDSVIDIGTGAGFPGLVLKIMAPRSSAVLVDSVGKKVNFVRDTASALGLDGVAAIHGRAEELGRNAEYRGQFALAVSRGVASLPALCEYCLPFVRKGGIFIAMKGPKAAEEIDAGARAAAILGGGRPEITRLTLPYGAGERMLVVITKEQATPNGYPRKTGAPEKQPLGLRVQRPEKSPSSSPSNRPLG